MKKAGKIPYLFIRDSTYYFRKSIPLHLRRFYPDGQETVGRSLKTKELKIAKARLAEAEHEANLAFASLERGQVSTKQLEQQETPNAVLVSTSEKVRNRRTTPKPPLVRWIDELSGPEIDHYIKVVASQRLSPSPISQHLLTDSTSFSDPHELSFEVGLELTSITDEIRYGTFNPGRNLAAQFLEDKGIGFKEDNAKLAHMAEVLTRIERYFVEQSLMDLTDGKKVHDPFVESYLSPASDLTFNDVADRYIQRKLNKLRSISYKGVIEKISVVRKLFPTDLPIRSISREHCIKAQELISFMPAHMTKRYPKLSVQEAVDQAKHSQAKLLNTKTAGEYLTRMFLIFEFAEDEFYIDKNPAKNLEVLRVESPKKRRNTFSIDELNQIFSRPLYVGCIDDERGYNKPGPSHPRRARFWAPLLCLWSGMRLEECLQLFVDDIVLQDGVPVILIRGEEEEDEQRIRLPRHQQIFEKNLKTAASVRFVPVHPELLKIGFIEFWRAQKAANLRQLFPELERGTNGTLNHNYSKWFHNFLDNNEIRTDGRNIVFHSFRHNYRDALRDTDIPFEIQLALGGWTEGYKKNASHNYGEGYTTQKLLGHISKIQYPGIKLSHLYLNRGSNNV